jgi:striatin 1/3/4
MRFLQTEWHRHERDRNAWEIERQEMKARIASLEGQGRRSDSSQKSLGLYVKMLEDSVKKERMKAKKAAAGEILKDEKENHVPKAKDLHRAYTTKLIRGCTDIIIAGNGEKRHNSFLDVSEPIGLENGAEEDRLGLKSWLNQCGGEFTYLMVSPSNPQPPQESPPPQPQLSIEDLGQARGLGPTQQTLEDVYLPSSVQKNNRELSRPSPTPNHQPPPVPLSSNLPIRSNETVEAPPMERSQPEQLPLTPAIGRGDWSLAFQPPEQQEEENITQVNHTYDSYGRAVETPENAAEEKVGTEADGWDFNEASQFAEQESKPTPSRPDTDLFPSAQELPKSPNRGPGSHRRKTSMSRRRSAETELSIGAATQQKVDGSFKVRFGLRGHLDAVRSVIFTGGGSPGEPEICTAGDDGVIKRWIIPARYENHGGMHNSMANDLDIQSYFTHRGHTGAVLCLTSFWPSQNFASGGRAQGDGWVFSGGQDASVRVWERGRVDPKATLDGHTDSVWTICVLPATTGTIFGQNNAFGGPDRILIASGSADGSVKVWSASAPPALMSPASTGSGRRGGGRVRGNSMSSGSAFPTSPQPSVASNSPFHYTLIHTIRRNNSDASPTCIAPLSPTGDNFVVSYSDAAVLVYDTRTGEEMSAMASLDTYDGTMATGVNSVVATTNGLDTSLTFDSSRGLSEDDSIVHGATGSSGGIEGIIISGHEDRYIRFYDANSGEFPLFTLHPTQLISPPGQCTYTMLAHPAAISALSLSPDGRELVSAGHDASLRFWSLEKRSCVQEITSHRLMRGEGVCSVVWSQDGRWVVSGGGDGVVKVFAR